MIRYSNEVARFVGLPGISRTRPVPTKSIAITVSNFITYHHVTYHCLHSHFFFSEVFHQGNEGLFYYSSKVLFLN